MSKQFLQAIEDEFLLLKYHWKIFCQLYDSGPGNIELLNKSGSNVFQLFQKLIIDDAILSLCRLTDPSKSAGKENASIKGYLEKMQANNKINDDEIKKLLSNLEEPMKNIRTYRHKAMAHSNLSNAMQVEALPQITYNNIETAISLINSILNTLIGSHYNNDYPHIPYGCDGNKLLQILAKAHADKR